MEFTIKPISLGDRAKINDEIYKQNIFSANLLACRAGLESLKGENINSRNFDEKVGSLTNDEIFEIGDKIIGEMNFSKKK